MTTSRYVFGAILVSLCLCGESHAAPDPAELKTPYQLRIVLHFFDHPQLTTAYRNRVSQELRDTLQAALGDLGRVEMLRDHDRLRDVLNNGLQSALDGWKERSGIKTHFVLVRYTGTEFEIQTRQHDGVTGQASLFTGQVVRVQRTRDREFVARTAALMVARDFGFIGTPLGTADAQGLVKVALKGSGLGVPLGAWVKEGEIFGLVGMPTGGQGETVFPWLFLRVEKVPAADARDGVSVCRLYFRHINPLGSTSFESFRCVKLGTGHGPVRLRLTQRSPSSSDALTLFVRRFGFEGEVGTALRESPQADGSVDTTHFGTAGEFDHLAFVSIHGSSATGARVPKLPVPILTDQFLDVSVPAAAEGDGLFRFQREEWTRNVTNCYLIQANLFKRLNELTSRSELRKEALEQARAGLARCAADYQRLMAERKNLDREIQQLPPAQRPNLSSWVDRLKKMKDGEAELVRFIETIENVERVENDPERIKWLAEMGRARLLEEKYEYGQALAIYENARKVKSLDSAELRERLAQLHKVWDPRSAKHAEARKFIYEQWPKLNTPGLKARLKEAKEAFDECKRAGDRLGTHKMLEALLLHGQRMEKEQKSLNAKLTKEDEDLIKDIRDISAELATLEGDINAFLNATATK